MERLGLPHPYVCKLIWRPIVILHPNYPSERLEYFTRLFSALRKMALEHKEKTWLSFAFSDLFLNPQRGSTGVDPGLSFHFFPLFSSNFGSVNLDHYHSAIYLLWRKKEERVQRLEVTLSATVVK